MRQLRSRYTTEELLEKVGESLDMISPEEHRSWVDHPSTKALVMLMQARISVNIDEWTQGGFADKGFEAAAQLNAKALGQVQVLEEFLRHILDFESNIGEN
jgi:transcriptional regulator with XRE-family HTH domain